MLHIYKFNDKWKTYFKKEEIILSDALKGHKYIKIEHIGATSIVLADTCGTIDLLLSIHSKIDFYTLKNHLVRKKYEFVASKSDEDMFFFVRRDNKGNIVATIRMVEYASKKYNEIKLFQYYLQEKDEHVVKYNEFKHTFYKNHKNDNALYEASKKSYIASKIEDHCKL